MPKERYNVNVPTEPVFCGEVDLPAGRYAVSVRMEIDRERQTLRAHPHIQPIASLDDEWQALGGAEE